MHEAHTADPFAFHARRQTSSHCAHWLTFCLQPNQVLRKYYLDPLRRNRMWSQRHDARAGLPSDTPLEQVGGGRWGKRVLPALFVS